MATKNPMQSQTNKQLIANIQAAARVDIGNKKTHEDKIAFLVKQIKDKRVKLGDPQSIAEYLFQKMAGVASGIRERQRLAIQEIATRLPDDTPANNAISTESPAQCDTACQKDAAAQ